MFSRSLLRFEQKRVLELESHTSMQETTDKASLQKLIPMILEKCLALIANDTR